MEELVVGLFPDKQDARGAFEALDLEDFVFTDLVAPMDGVGGLERLGIPRSEVGAYRRRLQDGMYLLIVRTQPAASRSARRILERHGAAAVEVHALQTTA